MKKLWIIGFFLIVLGIIGIVVVMFFPENGIDKNQAVTGLPSYTGQAIAFLGNDPILQTIPEHLITQYRDELKTLERDLAKTSDYDGWIRVGVLKKTFNNYEGAKDAWEYAKTVNPQISTAYYNLGGLYSGYLGDNREAEKNYLKALEVDPKLEVFYLNTAAFYRDFYTEKKDQAIEILTRGLRELPDNASLLGALEYYSE